MIRTLDAAWFRESWEQDSSEVKTGLIEPKEFCIDTDHSGGAGAGCEREIRLLYLARLRMQKRPSKASRTARPKAVVLLDYEILMCATDLISLPASGRIHHWSIRREVIGVHRRGPGQTTT